MCCFSDSGFRKNFSRKWGFAPRACGLIRGRTLSRSITARRASMPSRSPVASSATCSACALSSSSADQSAGSSCGAGLVMSNCTLEVHEREICQCIVSSRTLHARSSCMVSGTRLWGMMGHGIQNSTQALIHGPDPRSASSPSPSYPDRLALR